MDDARAPRPVHALTNDELRRIAQAAACLGASVMDIAEIGNLDTLAELLIEARSMGREHDLPGADNDLSLHGWRWLEVEITNTLARHRGAMAAVVAAWATIDGLAGAERQAA